ncbi:SAV_915 family protein [Streptacidiphilus sp. MAP5-3]|uniref:SAV_915 family protein n=1 Tax=unclassified Streptacidiphilus TaxID=2643834 RepID=UPI0035122CC4
MLTPVIGEDPEPGERIPAGLLLVPVRSGPAGEVIRFFRSPRGARTAIAFTSERQLAAVLGAEHRCVRLSEASLRGMAAALGVAELTVDPLVVASSPTASSSAESTAGWARWPEQVPARGVPSHVVVGVAGAPVPGTQRRRPVGAKR